MKAVFTTICFVVAGCLAIKGDAQTYYNPFEAVTGDLKQGSDTNYNSQQVKSTTVFFENGTNNLKVQAKIPATFIQVVNADSINVAGKEYLFELVVPIKPNEIQQKLTSTKNYSTYGTLTFNNVTNKVAVEYLPIISGTNQQGDFNIFLSVIFFGSSFGFAVLPGQDRLMFAVTNAKVNRL